MHMLHPYFTHAAAALLEQPGGEGLLLVSEQTETTKSGSFARGKDIQDAPTHKRMVVQAGLCGGLCPLQRGSAPATPLGSSEEHQVLCKPRFQGLVWDLDLTKSGSAGNYTAKV